MSRETEGFSRYTVICDDPYHRGCREQFGPYFGQDRVGRIAKENGWYISEETGKYACPNCSGLHERVVTERVVAGRMTREEADNSGDPFTAAFIAMALGGDPLTAGLTTWFTGSTPLGVIVGIMAGDHGSGQVTEERFVPGGGEVGGAGASGSFEGDTKPPVESEVKPETAESLPLIAEPFAAETPRSESAEEATRGEDPASIETPPMEEAHTEAPEATSASSY